MVLVYKAQNARTHIIWSAVTSIGSKLVWGLVITNSPDWIPCPRRPPEAPGLLLGRSWGAPGALLGYSWGTPGVLLEYILTFIKNLKHSWSTFT